MKIEDYNEYYIQGSDYYLIPKDVFMELFNEMINWKEESQRQKEVINNAIEYIKEAQLGEFPNGVIYWLKDDEVGKEILKILQDKEVLE